ncbi:MAG: EamA family transporter, partial [Sulfolobales archaeon]
NKAVSLVGSASAAPFSNLLPVFTAILGHMLLGEELGIGDILGGGLIIAGSAISMYGDRRYMRSDAREKEV